MIIIKSHIYNLVRPYEPTYLIYLILISEWLEMDVSVDMLHAVVPEQHYLPL